MDAEQKLTDARQEKQLQNANDALTPINFDLPENAFLHGRALILVSFALFAAVFMVALDNDIISTAIPRITSEFNSLDDVGWYGSAYLLTQMSLQPTFGKLYTLFNTKRVFLSALLIFEVGSVVCAAAPTSNSFILGRAVAGLGAAGILCGGLTILGLAVEERKRPLFLGFIGGIYGVSSVLGPTLGGLFTDTPRLTWRFCFWINLPFGCIAVAILTFLYKPISAGLDRDMPIWQKLQKLGIFSAIVLTGTITCLLLGVSWGGIKYSWADSRVWGCLLGAGLLMAVFVVIQFRNGDESLIPTRVISQRSMAISCIFTCVLQLAMMAQAYYLPFLFQAAQGTSAKVSGIQILPSGITIALATLVSGTLITYMMNGYYVPVMWSGAAIFCTGCYLLHTLVRSSTMKAWFGYQVLMGVGYGFAVQIPYLAVQVAVVSVDRPLANALVTLFQALGGAIGLSVAENVFQSSLVDRLARIPGINEAPVIASGGTDLQNIVSESRLDAVRDAFGDAIANVFLVSVGAAGAAFVASLGMEWRRIGAKKDRDNSVVE